MHVWSSWAVVCEFRRPRLVGPLGFHTTPREPRRAHFRVPAFKNTAKIQREDTQRDTERAKRWREREEKERNFGPSGGGGSSGGVRRKVVQGSPNQQQPQQPKPQQRQTQNKWGPEGPARSPKQGLGFGSLGVGHNNTTTHNTTKTTTTTPENFVKALKH